uniref:NADP-dependent oxidoreductase domain-containing protein n=1 Tax=Timema tahoe TaxID=61484 RepID=A0A7R9FF80_9NEOP|nr:unnamed protein product [Timema tahoe]
MVVVFSSKELPDLMDNPVVKEIAERLSRTPAQVLLRHTVQRGIAVIPKSTNKDRIQQNFKVSGGGGGGGARNDSRALFKNPVLDFTLSDEDVSKLDALDQGPVGRIVDFSFFKGLSQHETSTLANHATKAGDRRIDLDQRQGSYQTHSLQVKMTALIGKALVLQHEDRFMQFQVTAMLSNRHF